MLFALALTACLTEGQMCTDLYAYSTTSTVTSSSGETLTGVAGTYTVDGGPEQDCQPWIDGSDLVCGGETTGHFVITITADGHDPMTQEVDVEMDDVGCHVVGQALDFVLEPTVVDCTDVELPSVVVTLVADDGAEMTNAWVRWTDPNTDMAPQPCDPSGTANVWHCGWERAGDFAIGAGADYYSGGSWEGTVGLTADECHVDTQHVELELTAYDCLQ